MKKESRFLEPVCTVRDDDPRNLRALLERRIDIASKLQPLVGRDICARNIGELHGLDLSVFPDLRNFCNDLMNRLSDIETAERPRLTLLAGDRAAGYNDQNSWQFRWSLRSGRRRGRTGNNDETQKQRGNRESFEHCSRQFNSRCFGPSIMDSS